MVRKDASASGEGHRGGQGRRRGRPRSADADRRIVDAALARLVEVGYERLRVDDVAAAASVAKTTMYRRWPSKQALVAHAVRQLYAAEVGPVDHGDLRADLVALLTETHRVLFDERSGHVLEGLVRASGSSPDLAEVVRTTTAARRRAFHEALRRGEVRGEVAPGVDRELVVDLLIGPLWTRRLVTGSPLPAGDLAAIVGGVLDGVGASGAHS